MKQTAVDWLFFMLNNPNRNQEFANKLLEKAKEIEKEQIVKASAIAYEDMFGSDGTEYGEKYYNKTFKSE